MTVVLANFDSWRGGYRIVAGFQLLMALSFAITLSWWNSGDSGPAASEQEKRLTDYKTPMRETMRQSRVWLSVLLFFLYVGAEVSLGTWAFTLLTESRGVPTQTAGFWTGSYWATFTIGRILAGLYAKRLGVHVLVQGGVGLAFLGAVLLWWHPFELANLLAVGVVGIAVAPIFPAMISGTSQRVGAHFAANTIGMQMAATGLGTAVIPSLLGVLAAQFSLEIIPVCLALVFLSLFGLYRLSMIARVQPVKAHAD
jgi:fucose permease